MTRAPQVNAAGELVYLENAAGDGTAWTPRAAAPAPDDGATSESEVLFLRGLDVDADGWPDVLVARRAPNGVSLVWHQQQPGRAFSPALPISSRAMAVLPEPASSASAHGGDGERLRWSVADARVQDIDGDGDGDLFVVFDTAAAEAAAGWEGFGGVREASRCVAVAWSSKRSVF